MIVINAKNVNDALMKGTLYMTDENYIRRIDSRNGPVVEMIEPVTTVYERPWERVLINPIRDANPFFHFMESLWILAGRSDVQFLTEFNKRMGDYSDDGVEFNAPYGYRLRNYFFNSRNYDLDQLEEIINILKKDPNSRQAVAQIWDTRDLDKNTKDKACNMFIVFSIRENKLHMTVFNRSNDMLWGAYGANAVQFSMIQEYVAAHLNISIGTYTQVSNSFHVYTSGAGGELWNKIRSYAEDFTHEQDPYQKFNIRHFGMHHANMKMFDEDLELFFDAYDEYDLEFCSNLKFQTNYFNDLVKPMLKTWLAHKHIVMYKSALGLAQDIMATDWRIACLQWLQKRTGAVL